MNEFKINAETRSTDVKNPTKKALREGKVIGVVYNNNTNIPITLNLHDFEKVFNHLKSNSVIDLKLDGKEEYTVVLKDFTHFLKSYQLQHIDFFQILPNQKIKILVPIELEGRPVGVTKGGLIQRFTNHLLVNCTTETIPDRVRVDISKMDISDFLHLKDIEAEGVQFLESPDKAIVAISTTKKSRSTSTEPEKEDTAKESKEAEAAAS